VLPAVHEPAPGWTDNMNGPSGTYVLVGAGLCRIFDVDGLARPASVPVDLCSNAIVVAGWNTDKRAKEGKSNHRVYNSTGTTQHSWRDSMELACTAWEKFPLDKMLVRSVNTAWVDKDASFLSKCIFRSFEFVSHTVPGYFIDVMRTSAGQRPIAVKAYRRLDAMLREYKPWATGTWSFGQSNLKEMHQDLTLEDQKAYLVTADSIAWPKYMENYMLGLRKYILKDSDSPEAMDKARKKYSQRWWVGLVVRVAITWMALKATEALGLIRKRKMSSRMAFVLVLALAQASRLARIVTAESYSTMGKIYTSDRQKIDEGAAPSSSASKK